jgi:hypothetical protein
MAWTIPNLVLDDKPVPLANLRAHGRRHVFVNCGTSNLGTGEGRYQRSQMKQRAPMRAKSKSRSSSTWERAAKGLEADGGLQNDHPLFVVLVHGLSNFQVMLKMRKRLASPVLQFCVVAALSVPVE